MPLKGVVTVFLYLLDYMISICIPLTSILLFKYCRSSDIREVSNFRESHEEHKFVNFKILRK